MSESLAEFARPLGRRERIAMADTPIYAEVMAERAPAGAWVVVDTAPRELRRRWWWFW